jgi:protein required for attachment to host cells
MVGRTDYLLPNEPTCIAACASDCAKFWLTKSRFGKWQPLASLEDPAASKREQDFASDRPGRSFDRFGAGRHALSISETGRDHESRIFARTIAKWLDEGINDGAFVHIVLIATPRILGHLRKMLSDTARQAVVAELAKDVTDLDTTSIRDYFR